MRGDLTRSQTGNFRRPVLPSNIDLFETFDHGETQEGEEREEREERKTSTKAGTEGKTCDLYNYNTHVSMDACSHVATDFVSDVLLSLNYWYLFVTIRCMFDLTLICVFFILSGSCSATRGGEQIVLPTRTFLFKAAIGTMTV